MREHSTSQGALRSLLVFRPRAGGLTPFAAADGALWWGSDRAGTAAGAGGHLPGWAMNIRSGRAAPDISPRALNLLGVDVVGRKWVSGLGAVLPSSSRSTHGSSSSRPRVRLLSTPCEAMLPDLLGRSVTPSVELIPSTPSLTETGTCHARAGWDFSHCDMPVH